ncbi:19857_t:CDS:2, partial [Racocetra persica]
SIQNALKYNKKLYYPSISELEKVCSIMDKYKGEGTVISKQYGIKNAQDPKEQAILLGIASTIMLALLTKYLDLLAVDSTTIFVNDKETIPVINLMFESWLAMDKWDPYLVAARKYLPNTQTIIIDVKKLQIAARIASLAVAETIASYFRKYWFGD